LHLSGPCRATLACNWPFPLRGRRALPSGL